MLPRRLQYLVTIGIALSANLTASSICATVEDATGRPVTTATIVVVNLLAPANPRSGPVSPSGKACVEDLPEGLYSVEAGSSGLGHLKVKYYPVRVVYPDNVNLSFELPIGEITEGLGISESTLSGTLAGAKGPAEGVRICLYHADETLPVSCSVTNDLGQYALVVAPGKYKLEVTQRQGPTQKEQMDLSEPGYYRNRVVLAKPH